MGSAESDDYDQLLDSVDVGPMQARAAPVCRRPGLDTSRVALPRGLSPLHPGDDRTLQTTALGSGRRAPPPPPTPTRLTTITTVTTTTTIL